MAGNLRTYAACKSYASDTTSQTANFQLLWSVLDNGNGSSTLDAAINVVHSGWAGLEVPSRAGSMVGGSAMMVSTSSTSPTGATVKDCYLAGYTTSSLTTSNRLTVLSSAAAGTSTTLQASFALLLSTSGSALASFNAIIAVGPVGTNGARQEHTRSQAVSFSLDLTPGLVTSASLLPSLSGASATSPGSQAPAPVPASPADAATGTSPQSPQTASPPTNSIAAAPALTLTSAGHAGAPATPTAAQAPVAPSPSLDMPASGPNASSNAGLSTTAGASAPTSAPVTAQSIATTDSSPTIDNVAASDSTAAPTTVLQANGSAACSMAINSQQLTFQQCQALSPLAGSARLLWTLVANAEGSGSVLNGALEAQLSGSYLGIGFPQTPGVMCPSNALIVQTCALCSSGASAAAYSLQGKDTSSVVQSNTALDLASISATSNASGWLQTTFSLKMSQSLAQLNTPLPIIAAVGPLNADGSLGEHTDATSISGSINFGSGESVVARSSNFRAKLHGWLMAASWGFLIPLGALAARFLRSADPLWFHMHRGVQTMGFFVGLVGLGFGIDLGAVQHTRAELVHRILGIVINVLGALQVLAIVARPDPKSPHRRLWNVYHYGVGRVAIALAIANVFLGLRIVREPQRMYVAYAAAIGGVLLLSAILKVVVRWRSWAGRSVGSDGMCYNDSTACMQTEVSSQWQAGDHPRHAVLTSHLGGASRPI